MKTLFFLLIPIFLFSQNENIEKMKKLPTAEFEKVFSDSIANLNSLDLWNFIKEAKESEIELSRFNSTFINRFENAKWANELGFLLEILIEQKTENSILEKNLNDKKEIWDKGEWSGKFWRIIIEHKLKIIESDYFVINEKGEKEYNLKLLIEEKIKRNEIGENPLLEVNYSVTKFNKNELLETLEKLNIKDIQVIPKQKSVSLFGKNGIDGVLKVLTK